MITIPIDPILVVIGPFSLRWYSVFVSLAILAGVFLAVREARRTGISEDEMYSIAFWAVLGGIAGSRLFHVIDRWEYYGRNPLSILALQEGGLAIYGGLVVGAAVAVIYALRRSIPVWRLADTVAPAVVLGQAIGRIGCIINGCAYGVATTSAPAFIYLDLDAMVPRSLIGVPTQPVPLYELIVNLLIFAFLWKIRKRVRTQGMVFLSYAILHSAMRFGTTFLRQEQIVFSGLQQAQVISIAVIAIAIALLVYRMRKSARGEQVAPARAS